jgi:hypothetical protein
LFNAAWRLSFSIEECNGHYVSHLAGMADVAEWPRWKRPQKIVVDSPPPPGMPPSSAGITS